MPDSTTDVLADISFADIVAASPVATLLLDVNPDQLGHIHYANRAAQVMFAGNALDNVLDLVATNHVAQLTSLLSHPASTDNDVTQVERAGRDAAGREFTLHMRALPEGPTIVQAVGCAGWDAVDDVVTEQQRFRSALMELNELAHTSQDDNDFYHRLLERAVEVVPGAQGGSVQLKIPGKAAFRFVAAVGYDLEALQTRELHQEQFFRDTWDPTARMLHSFDNDGRTEEVQEFYNTVGRLNDIKVNVSGPVLSEGFPVAFLALDNFEDPNAMNETSVEMTTVLSRFIGELWQRRELEAAVRKEREAFRHLALHDPLTGLANRRNVERLLNDMVLTRRGLGQPSCVLFVDIDDFKGVNDRLGHEVGDQLLIGVARKLEAATDPDDVVGRWGGDEFLIVSRRMESLADAELAGERVLRAFEDDLDLGGGVTYRARISVGVAWSHGSGIDITSLIRAADEALYEAKAAGKGLVRVAKPSD